MSAACWLRCAGEWGQPVLPTAGIVVFRGAVMSPVGRDLSVAPEVVAGKVGLRQAVVAPASPWPDTAEALRCGSGGLLWEAGLWRDAGAHHGRTASGADEAGREGA